MKQEQTSLFTGISGIGVDIIEIKRIEKALQHSGKRFQQRIFTPAERSYCEGKAKPQASYAARFAAKEAVLKALGIGISSGALFTDVEVYRKQGGAPGVNLYNKAAGIAKDKGVTEIKLSLSHDRGMAIAFAVTLRGS